MSLVDLHVHSTFSDGKNTPEEVVLAAIGKGMKTIGFSDHSYTAFDESYCIGKDNIVPYIEEISRLKQKYKESIEILLGIEQDLYSDMPTDRFDYVIGSVHYVKIEEQYIPVDESPEILRDAVNTYFGGDIYALIEQYYRSVSQIKADIIGHLDLIAKFNEDGKLFDETHPRYVAAYQQAVDQLLVLGKPFEINTGAMSRGYRTTPYPARPIREYIQAGGGSFILSSDSHQADTLCFAFET